MGIDCYIVQNANVLQSLGRWRVFRDTFEGYDKISVEKALELINDILAANKQECNCLIDAIEAIQHMEGYISIVPETGLEKKPSGL